MCFFITIAVPEGSAGDVCAAWTGRGMSVAPTKNPSARAAAGAGRAPLLVTGGGCSCAWYTRPSNADLADELAKARAKYERRGWSRAKIERALAGMSRPTPPGEGLHPVVLELLGAVAARCGRVAVWVHDFSGAVEREPYTLRGRESWPLEELAARAPMLTTDVLAEIDGAGTPPSPRGAGVSA